MTGKTSIEWTQMPGFEGATWNPTTGCTRVSAGCDNCYAFALHDRRFSQQAMRAKHFGETLEPNPVKRIAAARAQGRELPWPKQYDRPFSHVQLLPERLEDPLRKRKPTCYFVDSMADLFHEDVPYEFRAKVWDTMAEAEQHRFLILTKRPERMRQELTGEFGFALAPTLPNVWLGTSVEDQKSFNERVPYLRATPAALRFLSVEPLIGPLGVQYSDWQGEWVMEPSPIQWLIVGGESGPRARPFDLTWARSLRAQCRGARVAFFMKQLGSRPGHYEDDVHGRVVWIDNLDIREAHGRDMAEWPEDLRIREWPR